MKIVALTTLLTAGLTALLTGGLVLDHATINEIIIANCVMTPMNWVLTYNTLQ